MIKTIKYLLSGIVLLISLICFIVTLFLIISAFMTIGRITTFQFINLICALIGCSFVNYFFMWATDALNSSNRFKEAIYAK